MELADRLTDRLAEVFRDHGYSGTSIAALAERAGLSKASLYHHFPGGKQDMAEAVIRRGIAVSDRLVYAPLRGRVPALVRLQGMLDGYLLYSNNGRQRCLVTILGQNAPASVRAIVSSQWHEWRLLLESTLCELKNVKPKRAARLADDTLCGLYGGSLLAELTADEGFVERSVRRLRKAYEMHS